MKIGVEIHFKLRYLLLEYIAEWSLEVNTLALFTCGCRFDPESDIFTGNHIRKVGLIGVLENIYYI